MREDIELREGERIDDLQRAGYGIIQRAGEFCFGMDAVLLSSFARVGKGETLVDLGTGTGIIPILMAARYEGGRSYGVELSHEAADMAERSVRLNALEEKIRILRADLRCLIAESREFSADEQELRKLRGRVRVVTANPPYMKTGHALVNPDERTAMARHEICCTLRDVCRAASKLLASGGHFYMVHRPLRLPEIITELASAGFEAKRLRPVHPFIYKEANMILIDAVLGGAAECRFEAPVIVYRAQGEYTRQIREIYGCE